MKPVPPPKPADNPDPLTSKESGDLTREFMASLQEAESELPFPVEQGAFDALFRLDDDAQFERGLNALLKRMKL